MREFSINEAAKATNIPRSVIQKAVVTGILPHKTQQLGSMRMRYMISLEDLNKFAENFDETKSLYMKEVFDLRGNREQAKRSDRSRGHTKEEMISSKIRRKLEVLREAKECGIQVSELY